MSRSGLCALRVAICLVSSAAAAGHFTTFTVPGATDTQATAINAVGTVTGFYSVHGQKQGFVRATDGTITTFAAPGLADVVPTSINAAGWIAGYAGSGQSFLRYPDGSTQVFHVKGARYTTATTINVSGYISGTYTNADNTG